MREILFRGKRENNDEWVEGFFVENHFSVSEYRECLIRDLEGTMYKVIPETVGQYTGLTDKNGKKIFEGDIVTCDGLFCGVVYFHEGAWCATERDNYPEVLCDLINLEVIGNIHDNPELLER